MEKFTVIALFLLLRVMYVCLLTHIYTFVFLNQSVGPGNIRIHYVWSHLCVILFLSVLCYS